MENEHYYTTINDKLKLPDSYYRSIFMKQRRLNREKSILDKLSMIKDDVDICYNSVNNSINYEITFMLRNGTYIIYKIPHHYPFKSPRMYINGSNYIDMLCVKDEFTRNELISYGITECLCKNSLVCHNNWSPAITLDKILHEYINNKKIMSTIIKKRWLTWAWYKKEINAPELIDKIMFFVN